MPGMMTTAAEWQLDVARRETGMYGLYTFAPHNSILPSETKPDRGLADSQDR
jgi:hypothetical protein